MGITGASAVFTVARLENPGPASARQTPYLALLRRGLRDAIQLRLRAEEEARVGDSGSGEAHFVEGVFAEFGVGVAGGDD